MTDADVRPVEILLVEDSPSDAQLTAEAFRGSSLKNRLSLAEDGVDALDFLRQRGKHTGAPRPDLILLDLNLPRKDGREVLAEIKADEGLRMIPVVVLSICQAEEDLLHAYRCRANSYVAKPAGCEDFLDVVRRIESFWVSAVTLPPRPRSAIPDGGEAN